MTKRQRVLRIAHSVRKWAEQIAIEEDWPDDLLGFCARASGQLYKELKKEGIQSKIVLSQDGGTGHCFVVVDECVVDVTATQFSCVHDYYRRVPKVIYRKWSQMKKMEDDDIYPWNGPMLNIVSSVYALRKLQRRRGWPRDQTV